MAVYAAVQPMRLILWKCRKYQTATHQMHFSSSKMHQNSFSAGTPPQPPGELTTLPGPLVGWDTPSPFPSPSTPSASRSRRRDSQRLRRRVSALDWHWQYRHFFFIQIKHCVRKFTFYVACLDVCNVVYECSWCSSEPGYYEVGSFGIRLETLVTVVKANTPVHHIYFSLQV